MVYLSGNIAFNQILFIIRLHCPYVTSTPGHVLTTSLLRPKKIEDVVRTWYGLVGRGRNVVRT